jgi:hypothetical protein
MRAKPPRGQKETARASGGVIPAADRFAPLIDPVHLGPEATEIVERREGLGTNRGGHERRDRNGERKP